MCVCMCVRVYLCVFVYVRVCARMRVLAHLEKEARVIGEDASPLGVVEKMNYFEKFF